MAEPSIISPEQFHDIFGSSDEESNTADSDGSDIDVQELESDVEEGESDNDSDASDTIEWSDQLEDFDIDEFSGQQGMTFNVPDDPSPNDFFSQLFGDSVIDTIVTETNRYARQKLANNSETEPPRANANYDRLFKIRTILSIVLDNIQNAYEPSKNLSVDEAMIACKGRLSFRQYMPAKPTKYGIKVWMATDSQNGYVTNFAVYLGQEGNQARLHGLGYDVVMKMARPFLNKNRHVFFDNFFTSTTLMEHLLAQNTYACGTVRSNQKDLPPC